MTPCPNCGYEAPAVRHLSYGTTLVIDTEGRRVWVREAPVQLRRKEFDLLEMFVRSQGIVLHTPVLYAKVWSTDVPLDTHTVKVHVSSLRGKLGPEIGKKIMNLHGIGYRMEEA